MLDRRAMFFRRFSWVGCAVAVSVPAFAEQVVVTEVTYVHSASTTTDSHYRPKVLPATPPNWVSPVNYSQGTAYVRLEVFTKPSDAPTRFQVCFEATPNYACTDQAPAYTKPGVYTWATPFPRFYQYNLVDWSKGTRAIALILKDTNNVKPAPENVGPTVAARYMPTSIRVTVTLVSPGGTYLPPMETDAGTSSPDAGVIPDAGRPQADAGNTSVDASVPSRTDSGIGEGGHFGGGSSHMGNPDGGVTNAQERLEEVVGCSSTDGLSWLALGALAIWWVSGLRRQWPFRPGHAVTR